METVRPYITLSVACSLDGCIGVRQGDRLILSSEEDLDAIDELRAQNDAILVGAETVRRDNSRLLIKDLKRRKNRLAVGMPQNPHKVTLSRSGDFEFENNFFQTGPAVKLLYCVDTVSSELREKLGGVTEVISGGSKDVELDFLLSDLSSRGITNLLVEGGASILGLFLKKRCFDELRLAIAPFIFGGKDTVRLFGEGEFNIGPLKLKKLEVLGSVVVHHYIVGKKAAPIS